MFDLIWKFLPDGMRLKFARNWFNEKRRRIFYLKVSELLANGVKIADIVISMKNRAARRSKGGIETWIYDQMYRDLSTTGFLSDGTRRLVPKIDQILIKAGETSGDLSKTLGSAADLNEKSTKMKSLIRKALTYPCILFAAIIGIICWFGASLFPSIEDFMSVDTWPALSRGAYDLAKFMLSYLPIVIAVVVAFAVFIWWSFPNLTGPIRIKLDKFPPWSLYRLGQGGAWILSISSMVSAGTLNIEAINTIYNESRGNRWLQERTMAVRNNISKSQSMGEALTTQYMFPDEELCEDMQDYARTGNFNEIFEKVGKEWIVEGVEKVAEQSKKLNGVATLMALLTVALMVQAVLGLFMDVFNNMSMM